MFSLILGLKLVLVSLGNCLSVEGEGACQLPPEKAYAFFTAANFLKEEQKDIAYDMERPYRLRLLSFYRQAGNDKLLEKKPEDGDCKPIEIWEVIFSAKTGDSRLTVYVNRPTGQIEGTRETRLDEKEGY
jgi:hypothetical protein